MSCKKCNREREDFRGFFYQIFRRLMNQNVFYILQIKNSGALTSFCIVVQQTSIMKYFLQFLQNYWNSKNPHLAQYLCWYRLFARLRSTLNNYLFNALDSYYEEIKLFFKTCHGFRTKPNCNHTPCLYD